MIIKELQCPLPLITPRGKAHAHFLIDYGIEQHLHWICFLKDSGECWTFLNTEIKLDENQTLKRTYEK